jgi:hypothetical protein
MEMPDPSQAKLPQAHPTAILQKTSFKAFEQALPPDRFEVRPEPEPDAGVDKCLELLIDGKYTGMRSHVQVKALTTLKLNSDGSISFSAEVSNLQYLSHGSSPLYVLYVDETKELRYVWVRDEIARIATEKPNWAEQDTVTLRFTKPLDEKGLDDIHDRIRREAVLMRQIHEQLGRGGVHEQTLHIDPTTLTISDTDAIREGLLQAGLTFVSTGNPERVLLAIDKLSYSDKQLPRLLLIQAFARFSQGRFNAASSRLMDLATNESALNPSDRKFAGLLRDSCDLQSGRISMEAYLEKQLELAKDPDEDFALSRRIDYYWYQLMLNGNRKGIQTYLPPLREAVAKVLAMKSASQAFRVQTKTAILYGNGVELVERLDRDASVGTLMKRVGNTGPLDALCTGMNEAFARWVEDSNSLAREAREESHPRLIGDVFYVRSYLMFVHYSQAQRHFRSEVHAAHLDKLRNEIIPDLRRAIACYEAVDQIEWILRAKVLLANVFHLTGDAESATLLASQALPMAKAYHFDDLARIAQSHIDGDPIYEQLRRKFLTRKPVDPDVHDAAMTDDQVRLSAEMYSQAHGLDSLGVDIFTRVVTSWRGIARERLGWCRYINLAEVSPERSASGKMVDPLRQCYCEKLNFESKIPLADWETVIKTFKRTYCQECTARTPKRAAPPSSNA